MPMKLDGSWEHPEPGIRRRLIALGQNLMTMEVEFESGAVGATHQHPHEQQTRVVHGRFRFHVGTETHTLEPNDIVVIPGNTPHGCECLEAGMLHDTFAPVREDLLER
jgi:quercetin dioxygenase-like cupin family protein